MWHRNWDILLAFLSIATQWRAVATATGGVYWMGLDYTAARTGMVEMGVTITPRLWAGVRTMERSARDALNGVRG